ncbi:hypothetical protein BUALT_Bualt15G0120600 [Buddleja alternifolia]|uniref:Uncharacterized protein n=1 Tax=Buddleja alternifolia TaxID=168488 RepID=A0AAV6WLC2_9LAMI|nr:hypothetical protein BUALT_Bualt15G0120600 [Buddleja alternifolia]
MKASIDNNHKILQQQLQNIVEQMQTYKRNKYVLGDGLQDNFECGSTSHHPNPPHSPTDTSFSQGNNNLLLRIEFPRFEGDNPRNWITKCNRYFQIISTIPEEQKVALASVHMGERAELWYQSFMIEIEPPI